MSTPYYGPNSAQNRLGEHDAAQRAERDAEQAAARAARDVAAAAQRTEGNAAAAATRIAREQESDAHSEQAHHWRPNRLPRPE
ncbi:MAG: hypothetical protein ACR2JW_20980 [Thermomicrobiales bacterium]